MNAVRINVHGDLNAVVDHKGHLELGAQGLQLLCLLLEFGLIQVLFPNLQESRSIAQHIPAYIHQGLALFQPHPVSDRVQQHRAADFFLRKLHSWLPPKVAVPSD